MCTRHGVDAAARARLQSQVACVLGELDSMTIDSLWVPWVQLREVGRELGEASADAECPCSVVLRQAQDAWDGWDRAVHGSQVRELLLDWMASQSAGHPHERSGSLGHAGAGQDDFVPGDGLLVGVVGAGQVAGQPRARALLEVFGLPVAELERDPGCWQVRVVMLPTWAARRVSTGALPGVRPSGVVEWFAVGSVDQARQRAQVWMQALQQRPWPRVQDLPAVARELEGPQRAVRFG